MKRILVIVVALAALIGLAACSSHIAPSMTQIVADSEVPL